MFTLQQQQRANVIKFRQFSPTLFCELCGIKAPPKMHVSVEVGWLKSRPHKALFLLTFHILGPLNPKRTPWKWAFAACALLDLAIGYLDNLA